MAVKKRIIVYIDGFNLYHGLDAFNIQHLKWFNPFELIKPFINPEKEELIGIRYYTAIAKWNAQKLARQGQLLAAWRALGVTVIKGRFSRKNISPKICTSKCWTYIEKETDVNLAIDLILGAVNNIYDTAILVSNDSDQSPTLNRIKAEYNKSVRVIIPPNLNESGELKKITGKQGMSNLKKIHFQHSQMEKEYRTENGILLATRPLEYDPPE